MNKEQAAEVFNLSEIHDRDDIQDAYEESFFTIRDYFLKNTVVPQLFVSRLQRLRKFEEAFAVLTNENYSWPELEVPALPDREKALRLFPDDPNNLEEFLKAYEQATTVIRTRLAQANSIPEIVEQTMELVKIQQAYHVLFAEFALPLVQEKESNENVRAGQQVDSGWLLRLLRDNQNSKNCELQEALQTEFMRVKKLLSMMG